MTNLPPVFIDSSGHCGGVIECTLPDAWEHPEGKFVRATDYLALRAKHDSFVIDTIGADCMRDLIAEQLRETLKTQDYRRPKEKARRDRRRLL